MNKTVTFSVKFLVTSNIDFKSECLRTFVLMPFCCFFCAGSNHFGIAGWYSSRALQHGIIVSDSCPRAF